MNEFTRKAVAGVHLNATLLAKWPPEILVEGFTPFPKRLLRCARGLFDGVDGVADLCAVLSIVDFRRPAQQGEPSLDYLAFIAGEETEAYAQRLHRLQEAGMIRIQDGGFGTPKVDLRPLFEAIQKKTPDAPVQ